MGGDGTCLNVFSIFLQVSPCVERAVLDQLIGYFESRLAGYPTTLKEDEDLVSNEISYP
jgi:Rubisco LSMT substrate-binding